MSPDDFQFIAGLLEKRSGLVLTQEKIYLLENRLMPVARNRGLRDLKELIGALRRGDESLAREVTDAMTTNESFFFRDNKPFEQFREMVLPNLITSRAAQKKIRIWSAACSSGQEPYSLAMILREEAAKIPGWRIEIIATDISDDILAKAKAGIYSQFEVQRGLPITLLVKYFKQQDEKWQIDPSIRGMVRFENFNLLDDPRRLGRFDVVFCRNVLIYFNQETKSKVLSSIADVMAEDGYLYLGGAETVLGISDRFAPIPGYRGIYSVNTPAVARRAAG